MGLYDVPDHPVIRNCERTGYPDGKTPEEPCCPRCGAECYETYRDKEGDVIGCDSCAHVSRHREDRLCPVCGNPMAFVLYHSEEKGEVLACDECVNKRDAASDPDCFPGRD